MALARYRTGNTTGSLFEGGTKISCEISRFLKKYTKFVHPNGGLVGSSVWKLVVGGVALRRDDDQRPSERVGCTRWRDTLPTSGRPRRSNINHRRNDNNISILGRARATVSICAIERFRCCRCRIWVNAFFIPPLRNVDPRPITRRRVSPTIEKYSGRNDLPEKSARQDRLPSVVPYTVRRVVRRFRRCFLSAGTWSVGLSRVPFFVILSSTVFTASVTCLRVGPRPDTRRGQSTQWRVRRRRQTTMISVWTRSTMANNRTNAAPVDEDVNDAVGECSPTYLPAFFLFFFCGKYLCITAGASPSFIQQVRQHCTDNKQTNVINATIIECKNNLFVVARLLSLHDPVRSINQSRFLVLRLCLAALFVALRPHHNILDHNQKGRLKTLHLPT